VSTVYQQMRRGRRIARTLAITPFAAGLLLVGSWHGPAEPETGLQSDGTYRVVDLESHLAMCNDVYFEVHDRMDCRETAHETWS
jgi:hypothetical protein